jgi:hypothetical protein
MLANSPSGKKATGIDQQIHLGSKVDGAEHLLETVAETQHGDELDFRLNRSHESRGSYYRHQDDYDWTRSSDVGPNRRFGETLEQQEKRHGREAEQARHRQHALDAHAAECDRAASSRQVTEAEQAAKRRDFWERKHLADGRETVEVPETNDARTVDPRSRMSQEELAKVNERAADLSSFDTLSRANAARRLAEEWDKQGNSFTNAVFAVLDQLADDVTVPTLAAGIDPDANLATVEGTITTLFDPASPNQYQVGYLEDDNGDSVKVTVWARSMHGPMVRTLREGDRVRISLGKPGEYNGRKTIAATSETCVCLLERGDGPAPTGECRASTGCDGSRGTYAPWDPESPTHQWANSAD